MPLASGYQQQVVEELFTQYQQITSSGKHSSGPPAAGSSYSRLLLLRSIPFVNKLLPPVDEKALLINKLLVQQRDATNYTEWYEISLELDELMNHNSWKLNPQSHLYDYDLIFNNLNEMRSARLAKDYKLLLYYIRTKWIRNLGNMGNINLYRHSLVGTKKLIEEYIDECQLSLDYLIHDPDVNLDDRYLLGMLIQTRKNIGRTALVLSGGSTFGIFHIGVLATLFEANLLPRIISGSSAGSIVASILCCHSNEDTFELLRTITERDFNIFSDDESPNYKSRSNFGKLLDSFAHFIKYGTLYDMTGLKQTMIGFLGDLTFREAYNRTGKILNITVSPASIHELTRLLNYLTAPNCLVWSAVCASCSLPGVFPSTTIYEKNPKNNEIHEWNNDAAMKYVDGSVDNDLPITRLLEMFNVDHIIAVQVNPHVVPVLKVSVSNVGGEIENELSYRFKHLLNNVYDFVSCEIIHYLQILNVVDVYKNLSNKLISVLSQNYSGDITILPDFKIQDFAKIFENPTPEFLLDFITRGARASWPKVTLIHNHCGVEFALDKAISLLRGRLITSANNIITFKESSRSKNPAKNLEKSDFTLVSSPVLNSDTSTLNPPNKVYESIGAPIIRRHNSSTSYPTKKAIMRPKRKSISSQSPRSVLLAKKKLPKGKSTTSLAALSGDYHNRNGSNESTLINDESEDNETFTTRSRSKTQDYGKSSLVPPQVKNLVQEQRNIRKARSSGNFHNSEALFVLDQGSAPSSPAHEKVLKYQSDRVPSYFNNPYLDTNVKTLSFELDTLNVEEKAKANLPRISRPSSKRNSYIGLNRLKDPYLSRSNNNSHYNLKDSVSSQELLSSDVRRGLMKASGKNLIDAELISADSEITIENEQEVEQHASTEGEEFLGDDEASNAIDDNIDDNVDDLLVMELIGGDLEDTNFDIEENEQVAEDGYGDEEDDDPNKVREYFGGKGIEQQEKKHQVEEEEVQVEKAVGDVAIRNI